MKKTMTVLLLVFTIYSCSQEDILTPITSYPLYGSWNLDSAYHTGDTVTKVPGGPYWSNEVWDISQTEILKRGDDLDVDTLIILNIDTLNKMVYTKYPDGTINTFNTFKYVIDNSNRLVVKVNVGLVDTNYKYFSKIN